MLEDERNIVCIGDPIVDIVKDEFKNQPDWWGSLKGYSQKHSISPADCLKYIIEQGSSLSVRYNLVIGRAYNSLGYYYIRGPALASSGIKEVNNILAFECFNAAIVKYNNLDSVGNLSSMLSELNKSTELIELYHYCKANMKKSSTGFKALCLNLINLIGTDVEGLKTDLRLRKFLLEECVDFILSIQDDHYIHLFEELWKYRKDFFDLVMCKIEPCNTALFSRIESALCRQKTKQYSSKYGKTYNIIKFPCGYCSKLAEKKCSVCKVAFYCNDTCQRKHWAVHKLTHKK